MKHGLLFLLLSSIISLISCAAPNNYNISSHKNKHQRGAHIFGRLDSANVQQFKDANIEWITLVSWANQRDYDSPKVNSNRGDSVQQVWRDSTWASQIQIAHKEGFKVHFKPHLWIHEPSKGMWRSDIFPESEEAWDLWKSTYSEFILMYAEIAQKNNVEMFCIGTEFSRLTLEKPDYWRTLIEEVRSVYSGQITYAANWYNEYEKIEFWDQLDYIGIQAYFPIVDHESPSLEVLEKGWEKYMTDIKRVSRKWDKKVLFTEMGYKSTTDAAKEPWTWVETSEPGAFAHSNETQALCYEAFFNKVWSKDWFAGVHIWQMRSDIGKRNFKDLDLDFMPQGKPAMSVIEEGFKN